jgi:hypothetical protein
MRNTAWTCRRPEQQVIKYRKLQNKSQLRRITNSLPTRSGILAPPRRTFVVHWIRGWVGPRTGLDDGGKGEAPALPPDSIRNQSNQSTSSHPVSLTHIPILTSVYAWVSHTVCFLQVYFRRISYLAYVQIYLISRPICSPRKRKAIGIWKRKLKQFKLTLLYGSRVSHVRESTVSMSYIFR